MRFATDTGGTFTDLIVEDDSGDLYMYKASTTPGDPVQGVLAALALAAEARGLALDSFLKMGDLFIHGTTHALNAVVTGRTAKTAFLTNKGHPDILLFREGGRKDPFDHAAAYPDPYIPRALTFEIPGRIDHDGAVSEALDEAAVEETLEELEEKEVEAIAVCLLWSTSNPAHELRIGELIEKNLPGIPYTLSHQVNPTMREYRRASSAAIDASLKPLMTAYLAGLTERLQDAGFAGRITVLTSLGGMKNAVDISSTPIHLLNSGPSMAPVAGKAFGRLEDSVADIIVTDTGGTTYDVSLVRGEQIPLTRDMWIGEPYTGHMTGFPSIDVQSIGAGGGSIAWVDEGRLLHVGPQSQGASPGPACYGRGGEEATVTDAALVLGYLDPAYFLGGTFPLDATASARAVQAKAAGPLGLSVQEAACAIINVATENMVQAIIEIAVNQGVDPGRSILVGGGGAAGMNSSLIACRLGCKKLIYPELGAALSATGATLTDMIAEFRQARFVSTGNFDFDAANRIIGNLTCRCRAFLELLEDYTESAIELSVEARYENQVWEIDLPLRTDFFSGHRDVRALLDDFHRTHERIFAIRDDKSPVEIVNWRAIARAGTGSAQMGALVRPQTNGSSNAERKAYFPDFGELLTPVIHIDGLEPEAVKSGPAIVETAFTTIVIQPQDRFYASSNRNLVVEPLRG